MSDLRATAKSLHHKLKQISEEIEGKEKEIQDLRQANSKLVEANLDKQRKPKSLEVQRNAIVRLDVELLELRLVQKSLTEKLALADNAIKEAKLLEQIKGFQKESARQLQLFEQFNRDVKALETAAIQLESFAGGNNAIYALLRLCWDNANFIKQHLDLEKILGSWSKPRTELLSLNLDAIKSKASEAGRLLNNLWQQLNAVNTGSRTIPTNKLSVNHGQRVGTKSEVRMKQAAVEAVENAKQIKHKPFIQNFPQERAAPPG